MRWYGVLAVLFLLGAAAAPATAQHARDYARAGRVQPLDQILPHIRRSRPGTFYDAEGPFRGPDGRMHYRLKWMTPGGPHHLARHRCPHRPRAGRGPRRRAPIWERRRGQGRRYAPRDNGRLDRNRYRNRRPMRRDEFRSGPRRDNRRYAPRNNRRLERPGIGNRRQLQRNRDRGGPGAYGHDRAPKAGHDRGDRRPDRRHRRGHRGW